MLKKSSLATTLLFLGLTGGLSGWTVAQAAETATEAASTSIDLSLPNGENWGRATEREKMAYLLGIRDMAAVEYQLIGPNKPKHRTVVKNWVEALDGMTLRQIMETVDTYYKAHPDKQQQPVFEVVWFQMVEPKVGKPAKARAKAN